MRAGARRSLSLRAFIAIASLVMSLAFAPAVSASVTLPPGSITLPSYGGFLYMNSQSGDYIGGGVERLYTSADSTMDGTLPRGASGFHGRVINGYYLHWWYIDIVAPPGQPLAVGSYTGAVRDISQTATTPGVDVSGDGRGCNTLTGQFDVNEIGYNSFGDLQVFDATFEQHCEGATPALFGRIRLEIPPPTPGVTLPAGSLAVPTSGSFLYLNTQRDCCSGVAYEQLYTSADTTFSGSLPQGGDYFRGSAIQGSYIHWWYVEVAAPPGQPLAAGSYIRAVRAAFRPADRPGLDVYGDGAGCNEIAGKFDVDELSFWPTGELRTFQVTFEQHCDASISTLFGRFRIETSPPPPPLDLSVSIQDEGTVSKTGVVTVSGSVGCSRAVQVNLAGTLTQVVANRATISGAFSAQVACSPTSTRWSATVVGSSGRFGPGTANLTVDANACETKCYSASSSSAVKLTASK